MLRGGDFSMIKVWAGLEARKLITISVDEVSNTKGLSLDASSLTSITDRALRQVRPAVTEYIG